MPAKRFRSRFATLLSVAVATLGVAAATASAAEAASAPSLSSLPEVVAHGRGTTTLAVAFPQSPSVGTLRAAIVAASAFSGLTRHGITIVSVLHPSAKVLQDSPVPVIEMDPRPGPPNVSVRYLQHGNLLLTLAGQGQGLLNAAKLLSTKWIAALGGSSATLPSALIAAVAHTNTSNQASETLPAGSVSADGPVSISRQVLIPGDKVVDKGKATFRIGVEYNAPGGGQLTFKLNGNTLGAEHSRGRGNTFVYRFHLATVWTDGANLLPGYYLQPGYNTLSITAKPDNPALAREVGTQLAVTTHSKLLMTLSTRRATTQLDLWPFPLFANGSWGRTTVVMPPAASLTAHALSTLITALANSERLTGAPADPQITYAHPTAAQRRGDLLVFGNPQTVAGIRPDTPLAPGLISEQTLAGGGIALLVTDSRAMAAYGSTYYPGAIAGKTAVVDSLGQVHTIVDAPFPDAFATPRIVWLKPAAGLAALVLAWVAFRVFAARRRLRSRPQMPPGGVVS